jgi:hypothetical protein
MPDGQDKSDDLIAELAKLMANNAQGAEPEAKPAPKLVTLAEAPKPEGQGPAMVRIPGMDAPVAASQTPAPAVNAPMPPPADRPAPTPGVLRIPGMDQPVATGPAPAVSSPVPAAPSPAPMASSPAQKPAASFDFGTLPASTGFKPEPMANWQDREIPKPVPMRPAAVEASAPVARPVPDAPVPVRPAVNEPFKPAADPMAELEAELTPGIKVDAPAEPDVKAPPPRVEPNFSAPRPAVPPPAPVPSPAAAPMVAAAKASSTDDSFDFDFGFASEPPAPIPSAEARPQTRTAAPTPSSSAPTPAAAPPTPAISTGDPIADLIAAELDSVEADIVEDAKVEQRPVPAQPAARSFPLPGAMPVSRPASGPSQFRPQPTPLAAAPATPQPTSRPEDRFGVAPVFGPTSKVQAPRPQPAAERDPMDEIESLIGEAVRVELTSDKPATPAPQAQTPQSPPVVPPLTTGFAPRRAAIKDTEPQVPSAEAAILAAAAASGAEVGRIDGNMAAEQRQSPYKRPKAKPERRSGGMRPYVGMAVAGTLLLAAGFGLYWVLGMGRGTDADAPVLQADATPVKQTPPPTTSTTNQQGSVVFNELDGKSAAAAANEQLVSRDDTADTSVADVARTVGEGDDAANESELANRKVRTVTVRPDGTIVSGDEAVAGNEELPVARPAVPDLPGADVQPSELLAAVPDAATDPIASAIDTGADAAVDPTQVSALAPTGPAPTIDPSIVAPVPVARPTDRSVLGGGSNQRVAATQPSQPVELVEAPAAQAPASGGSGPYVQLSSQPTEGDAASSLRSTQNRLSGLLNGRSLAVRQVNLGAKGTWYRVVLPVDSFQEATQTCASLKANGVDCVPIGG